ncbi:retrovirus-related pol polyprotein from transposon TNT 1-94 [Tanacetum coccineum]
MRGTNTVSDVNANPSKVIRCYNCKGGGHIAKQCTAKKRVKDAEWLEEINDCDDLQLHTTSNFKVDHVDAYDSDCDDEATACEIFMASLSLAGSTSGDTTGPTYDSELLSEVPHYDNYHKDAILNDYVQETEYN